MENKGYVDFGGQTRCIMGNVEMVNITLGGPVIRLAEPSHSMCTLGLVCLTKFQHFRIPHCSQKF